MTNIWRHHESIDLDVAAIFGPFGNAGTDFRAKQQAARSRLRSLADG